MWLIVLFWVLLGLAIHPYVIYPVIILFWSILRPKRVIRGSITPYVSVVVAVYNEQDSVAERIQNVLAMDYPTDKLEVIIASDGSVDRTNEIVAEYAARDDRVKLLALDHEGQASTINCGVEAACGEIIIRTDAATRFSTDVVRKMVSCFSDENVQCVVGRITMLPLEEAPYNVSESLYWRFETRLRDLEALAGIAFVGGGPCMAIRADYYPDLNGDAAEDLTTTMKIIEAGGRIIQVSDLDAYDYMDGATKGQMSSRTRRVTLALNSIWHNRAMLNPFRYPGYSFSIMSHKIIRWMLGFWLIGMLITSSFLGFGQNLPLYRYVLYVQLGFYALALLGALVARTRMAKVPVLSIPMSVCVVSAAFLKGIARFMFGRNASAWMPAGSSSDGSS